MRKRQIPSVMEGMYGRRKYLGEQGKSKECDSVSQKIRERISQRKRRRSQMTRG